MKYIINENQYLLLKEYMQDGFSYETLSSLPTSNKKYKYCCKYLGEPVGRGIARAVFDVDEETVLKINISSYHDNSNQNEWNNVAKLSAKFDIFPKYYKHADDFSWITCESVLPMDMADCEVILGIPFCTNSHSEIYGWNPDYEKYIVNEIRDNVTLEGFIWWAEQRAWHSKYLSGKLEIIFKHFTDKEIRKINLKFMALMKGPNGKWFKDLYKYIIMTGGSSDLHKGNFGMARRNGKEVLVIIDSGNKPI